MKKANRKILIYCLPFLPSSLYKLATVMLNEMQCLWEVALKMNSSIDRKKRAQYSGFKLATSTFVLSMLEFIFIATSHKHCTFTITYARFGNLSLFASYAMLMRPRNFKTAAT